MKLIVTAQEILANGNWDVFCKITGLSVWAVNEGMDPEKEFELTYDQAQQCCILEEEEG